MNVAARRHRVRITMDAMEQEARAVVTFGSAAFNMAEPKDYFINPCCFGDDVANWLIGKVASQLRLLLVVDCCEVFEIPSDAAIRR